MPLVFLYNGYRFFFYSNEGNPLEPCHIHVRKGASTAKFWVNPKITLAEAYEMNSKEVRELMEIIEKNKTLIEEGGMNSFQRKPCATQVSFDEDNMRVELSDGRILIVPLAYFPRLIEASPIQRNHYVISGGGTGIHWEEVDEDLLVNNLLLGIFDQNYPYSSAA